MNLYELRLFFLFHWFYEYTLRSNKFMIISRFKLEKWKKNTFLTHEMAWITKLRLNYKLFIWLMFLFLIFIHNYIIL